MLTKFTGAVSLGPFSNYTPRIYEPYDPSGHDRESLEHFRVRVPEVEIVRCGDYAPHLVERQDVDPLTKGFHKDNPGEEI